MLGDDGDDAGAWSYDWENGHIATNFQIQVVMQTFEFCAGEVVQVHNFGAASTGSTVNLPGRWLIDEIAHSAGDVYATLSLVQRSSGWAGRQFTSKSISAGQALDRRLDQVTVAADATRRVRAPRQYLKA